MKKIRPDLLLSLCAAFILLALLLRAGTPGSIDAKDVEWRDFDCATDANKPYVSLIRMDDSTYTASVLVPYCGGSVELASAVLDTVTHQYEVVFQATPGKGDTTRSLLEQNFREIPPTAQTVKVSVDQDTIRETTIVVTIDADEESDGYPINEAIAMYYDSSTYTVSGFVYGADPFDPKPKAWVNKKANVDLSSKPPVSTVTFVRVPMHEQPQANANYQVLLKFANGSRGRSFCFKPGLNE